MFNSRFSAPQGPGPRRGLDLSGGYAGSLNGFGGGSSSMLPQLALPGPAPVASPSVPSYGSGMTPSTGSQYMPTMSTQGTSGGTPDILGAFNTTSALANTDGGGGGWLKNTFMNEGGGLNMDAIGGLAETIGAFGSLWSGIQSNKIAKKSLKFQEKAFNTNLTNQLQSYNTALSDRANARYQRAGSPEDAAGYIERNKLKAT